MAIIGIDLGTTNSLGCVYKNRESEDDEWDDPWADDDLTEEEAESAGDEDEMKDLWELLRGKTYLN